jgi:two-component system alkaline phosphatase synthesis response regulator PhoP
MRSRILLMADEPGLVGALSELLGGEGYDVESAADGPLGLAKTASGRFDLVILDVTLPGKSGLEVCRELRHRGSDVGILLITAAAQVEDRIAGLKLGADGCLIRPFEPPELVARVEALLRRVKKMRAPVARFQFGKVSVDFETGELFKNGARVGLAAKEMELLRSLIDRHGTVVSRDELLEEVWEYQPGISSRTVDVHVAWLRRKLEDNPKFPKYIHTVRGRGYRFAP